MSLVSTIGSLAATDPAVGGAVSQAGTDATLLSMLGSSQSGTLSVPDPTQDPGLTTETVQANETTQLLTSIEPGLGQNLDFRI